MKITSMPIICFLFPSAGSNLSGGLKVILEYANRLVKDGYRVHIAYAGSIFWQKKSLYHKLTAILRYGQQYAKGYSASTWFQLDGRVQEHLCWSLNEYHVPKADIYVATSPHTAIYLKDYKKSCKKFYLLQGFEDWGQFSKADVLETYRFPFRKIVISHWLEKKYMNAGKHVPLFPMALILNAFL